MTQAKCEVLKRVSLAQLAAVLQFDSLGGGAPQYLNTPIHYTTNGGPISSESSAKTHLPLSLGGALLWIFVWGAPSRQLGVSIMEALKQLKNCLWEIEWQLEYVQAGPRLSIIRWKDILSHDIYSF